MAKDKAVLDKEEAKKVLLVNKGMVHTFISMPIGLIGADHDLKSLLEDIDKAYQIRLTGGMALGMGHGIAIMPSKDCNQSDLLFVETTEKFNEEQKKNDRRNKKT